MADSPEKPASEPKEEIPTFRFSPKKVDDSWKEEVRRERELAAKQAAAAAAPRPAPVESPKPAEPAAKASTEPAEDTGADESEEELEEEAESEAPAAAAGAPAAGETPPSREEQARTKIFMSFLASLAQQALVQLGEMESPYSGQRELDLQGARYMIEVLAVLQIKTTNNLSIEENRALSETVRDLKGRYIEVTREVQREMAARAAGGNMRPGPGGSVPGPGFKPR